jgi:peptidoglycan/LPS O-acetylase OafA/YrhL
MDGSFATPAQHSGAVQVKDQPGGRSGSETSCSSPPGSRAGRNLALDFTKGLLVLLMVLYHWINYFVSQQGDFYKYIRFITPSFIFITGFLIANVYLAKYAINDPRLHKRLIQRGVKLLAIFTVLNLAVAVLAARNPGTTSSGLGAFLQNAGATYLTGNGRTAAFTVLVPISYLLILAPALLLLCRWHRNLPLAVCGLLFLAIYILKLNGVVLGHLELFTIGVLGLVLGRVPIEKINQLVHFPLFLVTAYVAYLIALGIWQEIYPLQIVGVCLSLLLMYVIGVKSGAVGFVQTRIIVLGQYSLLAYIVQIGVVLLLSKTLRPLNLGHATLLISFFCAFALTITAVELVARTRTKSRVVDWLYKGLFA